MTFFKIRECPEPTCRLRLPIEIGVHMGRHCPRCGAPLHCVIPAYQNQIYPGRAHRVNHGLRVILDNLRSAYNVGSIFRTSDGVAVEHIYLCGITPSPDDNSDIEKTALGAAGYLSWSKHTNALILARQLKQEGFKLLALECSPRSQLIQEYRTNTEDNRPTVLILGNERAGVDPGLIEICDTVLMLPMLGKKGSLNVAVAFGIAAYWLSFLSHSRL